MPSPLMERPARSWIARRGGRAAPLLAGFQDGAEVENRGTTGPSDITSLLFIALVRSDNYIQALEKNIKFKRFGLFLDK